MSWLERFRGDRGLFSDHTSRTRAVAAEKALNADELVAIADAAQAKRDKKAAAATKPASETWEQSQEKHKELFKKWDTELLKKFLASAPGELKKAAKEGKHFILSDNIFHLPSSFYKEGESILKGLPEFKALEAFCARHKYTLSMDTQIWGGSSGGNQVWPSSSSDSRHVYAKISF